jgi:hypothetical protein
MTDWQKAQQAIQERFPKHTKGAYSIAKRTEETGVMLCPEASEIENRVLHNKKICVDYHKLQHSFRVRVTKQRYDLVKQLLEKEGRFPTINAWLDWWIWIWINQKIKGRNNNEHMEKPRAAD